MTNNKKHKKLKQKKRQCQLSPVKVQDPGRKSKWNLDPKTSLPCLYCLPRTWLL